MSRHYSTTPAPTGLSGNLVAAVLLLNLVVFGGVLYAKSLPPSTQPPAEGLSVAFVQTQASIRLPTDTPLPTAIPSATPRPRPFHPDAQRVDAGEMVFQTVCSTCHGFEAQGISGLGPSMMDNTFINGLSNQELVAFISVGRPVDDPANVSGVAMPARGGNPSLTDDDLVNVVNYVRSLNPDTVVYEVNPNAGAPTAIPPTATPILATVTPAVFKPLDLSSIGSTAPTTTPAP